MPYKILLKYKSDMKKKALSFNFPRLWNSEYPLVIERILDIVKRYNPEELYLKKAYDRLESYQEDLSKIKIQGKTSTITETITQIDDLRSRLTKCIFNLVDNYKKLGIEPYTSNAKILDLWLSKYGKGIIRDNYTSQTEKTNQLLSDKQKNIKITDALENLHLLDLVKKLEKANTDFEELFRNRTAEIAKNPSIDVKSIRAKIDDATNKLFTAIIFCKTEHEDKNYTPLINELTELLSYHRNQIKTRTNKSKEVSSEESN